MTSPKTFVHRLREDLAHRRAALNAQVAMERELASYTSPRDIDDLLVMIGTDHDETAEAMRTVLLNNRRRYMLAS